MLRSVFDGSETFMGRGHGLVNEGRRGRKRTGVPDWVKDDEKVRGILLRAFPKLATDAGQRIRAGRWARVIDTYYREGVPASAVAADLGISKQSVEQIIRYLNRKPSDRPRGRPRK